MVENNISLMSIQELLDKQFFIPNYQRGYRWTKQQVRELLEDIKDFDDSKGFYCLQPLVVKKRLNDDAVLRKIKEEANSIADVTNLLKGSWEVIDGQQRLTTIYIILRCLGEEDIFSLEYETRKDYTKTFLDEENAKKNIDSYFMNEAYNTIETFKAEHKIDKTKLLNNVCFIWYETVEENPIKVFTRLNIGKISLTNSELIKALFLNSSNFSNSNHENIRLKQQEIAVQWDMIENSLQNDEFWLMLHEVDYDRPTRIDFIFDLVCKQNSLNLSGNLLNEIGNDDYRTFRYFYSYFKINKEKIGQENIEKTWQKVKSYYQVFNEWYNDVVLYHYIGFLLACSKCNVQEIFSQYLQQNSDKDTFIVWLKSKILSVVEQPKLDFQYDINGSNKGKCKPILLFHNVQTVLNQNMAQRANSKYSLATYYKFPFHLYKLEGWDVEHINSNTTNEETDVNTQREWLLNIYLSLNSEGQKKIEEAINNEKSNNNALAKCYDSFKSKIGNENIWTQEQKNQIWNYTLLDSSTNRSYGNSIFSAKRRIIISKDKGELMPIPKITRGNLFDKGVAKKADSSFVPPCTKNVFLKYYSPATGNNNYWTISDAKAYLEDIKMCIEQLKTSDNE